MAPSGRGARLAPVSRVSSAAASIFDHLLISRKIIVEIIDRSDAISVSRPEVSSAEDKGGSDTGNSIRGIVSTIPRAVIDLRHILLLSCGKGIGSRIGIGRFQ